MSTQEELEEFLELFATKPYDRARENLITLIDSAKREGAIEELKKLPSNRHESSSYCNAEFFIDSEDRWKRIKELEQSEESE